MTGRNEPEHIQTVVIGGGQAGLSVGYHLQRLGLPFVILDANERIGDAWRQRWDSLRLFTPAHFDGLDGRPFPAPWHSFPTKDEMADYLEEYARDFELPVLTGVRVERLVKDGDGFLVEAGLQRFEADNVVIAMANFQKPRVPEFATQLDAGILQLHSSEYRSPSQLRKGDVLVVGAGNSGAEIAKELSQHHHVSLSGKSPGQVPFRVESPVARIVLGPLFRVVFHRLLTVKTPMGRRARRKVLSGGEPLIRVKRPDLAALGVEAVPRVTGWRSGLPLLEDGRVLEVANVVWCTGYEPGFEWIDLPVLGDLEPLHEGGIVKSQPGLYFVGLKFLYSFSSVMIHGVGRDAARVAKAVESRVRRNETRESRSRALADVRS